MTEDEMVGWHHCHDGHGFEQAPGDGEGQESLAHFRFRGHRVRHDWVTEQRCAQGVFSDPLVMASTPSHCHHTGKFTSLTLSHHTRPRLKTLQLL